MDRVKQKRPGTQGQAAQKKGWARISTIEKIEIGIVAVLIALAVFFFTNQKEIWEGRLNQATEQLNIFKQENATLKQENERLKEELKAMKVLLESESKTAPSKNPKASVHGSSFEVSAMKDQTVSTQDLKITPVILDFKPDPARYTVTAKVQYKDLPEMQLRDAEVGASVTYPKEHGYSIKVVKTDSVSATFSIVKNP